MKASSVTALCVRVVCVWMILIAGQASAIDIVASGNWLVTNDASDLIGGAGTDLTDTYSSTSEEVLITISNTAGVGDNWRVDIKKTITSWPPGVSLYARRTGDGTGSGSIVNGMSYTLIEATDTSFFSGSGDRSSIPIQLRITGATVGFGPSTYSLTVTYTVVDTA